MKSLILIAVAGFLCGFISYRLNVPFTTWEFWVVLGCYWVAMLVK